MDPQAAREQNRRSWNAVVPAHESHRGDLAGFLRAGGLTLFPEERELLGPVAGRRLLHLMCNNGQDSLSLAALGAAVTGVDISDEAVARAEALSAAAGLAASFVRADLYDFLAACPPGAFEAAYCGYGAVCWLSDLAAFAAGVARALAPGGRLALVDFHPTAMMFDRGFRLANDYYADGAPLPIPGVGDYVGESGPGLTPAGFAPGVTGFVNPEPATLYRWGLGEVVTALAGAGLTIVALREYPFLNGERQFDDLREVGGRRLVPPPGVPRLPLMYGVAAAKPGAGRP